MGGCVGGGGCEINPSSPCRQVACVFVSSFFSSWNFGGVITYIEGRRSTETMVAVLSFFFIYAGKT